MPRQYPGRVHQRVYEITAVFGGALRPGESVTLEKRVVYTDSVREKDCEAAGKRLMDETLETGTDALFDKQEALLRDWYRDCCVKLDAPYTLEKR